MSEGTRARIDSIMEKHLKALEAFYRSPAVVHTKDMIGEPERVDLWRIRYACVRSRRAGNGS